MTTPAGQTLDMGPIYIEGCTFSKASSPNGRYTLSLSIGPNRVEVVASPAGNNVQILMNGVKLESAPPVPAEDYH